MAAAPLDLTSDMALIAEHQRISYVALMVLGMDGMRQMGRACLLEGTTLSWSA